MQGNEIDNNHDDEYTDEDWTSKSELKRDADELQQVGIKLMEMKANKLKRLPLSDSLIFAIEESKRIQSNEARRRHAQYMGKLMRQTDSERLLAALEELESPLRQKRLQDWLERIDNCTNSKESGALVQEFLNWYPDAERQHLMNLCRNVISAKPPQAEDANHQQMDKFKRERRKLSDFINDIERNTLL